MKQLFTAMFALLCFVGSITTYAQGNMEDGQTMPGSEETFVPGAIYEVRYWTNMASLGDGAVYIDTMIFHGGDRAAFEYSNSDCISYHCKDADGLIYKILPELSSGQKEWVMESGKSFVRRLFRVAVPFRNFDRTVYKVYVSDIDNKDTGLGDYMFVNRQFGIVYRYNADGEVFMLNRIDVLKDGVVKDEIDLLPLQQSLANSNIYGGIE